MAEQVDLNVVCKNCGSEVSPYITECPYCGQRLRKRAPKLRPDADSEGELAPAKKRRRRFARKPREDRPMTWLSMARPYATITVVLASGALYIAGATSSLSLYDLGAIIGPLQGDWWRLIAAQFVYENVGYLFAVAVATAIFGTSLERRYGAPVMLLIFLGAGAAGMYLASETANFPVAMGGNASALGLLCAWAIRDLRSRQAGEDTESDLFGVVAIAVVLGLMPVLELTADAFAGLGGAVVGSIAGPAPPEALVDHAPEGRSELRNEHALAQEQRLVPVPAGGRACGALIARPVGAGVAHVHLVHLPHRTGAFADHARHEGVRRCRERACGADCRVGRRSASHWHLELSVARAGHSARPGRGVPAVGDASRYRQRQQHPVVVGAGAGRADRVRRGAAHVAD